jgi:hypothetical protein
MWIILIATLVIFGVGYWLYTIGLNVKAKEVEIVKSVKKEKKRQRNLLKYSRKHFAKTPTIQK